MSQDLHVDVPVDSIDVPTIDSVEGKLKIAEEHKLIGNQHYKQQKYVKAAAAYHRAILYLKAIDADVHGGTPVPLAAALDRPRIELTPDIEQACIKTNIDVYNNLAACLLQYPKPDASRVDHFASIVIELDSENEKAWFRKGQALMMLSQFEEALEAFKKSGSLSEKAGLGKKTVVIKIHECELAIKKAKEKEVEVYKKMFK